MWDIVFLANAIQEKYELFLVPFAFFALTTHPNGFVEMVVESVDHFQQRNGRALQMLYKIIPRFCVRPMQYKRCKRHIHNTYRFLETPQVRGKYTYVMDVDVMLLENILKMFEDNWPLNCVFNNMIRCNGEGASLQRLTGMHMVQTNAYYTDAFRKVQHDMYHYYSNPNTNDEFILYNMVKMCHQLPPLTHRFRPILGIHFSPNRGPGKSMNLSTTKQYAQLFREHASHYPELFALPQFVHLSQQLNDEFHIN